MVSMRSSSVLSRSSSTPVTVTVCTILQLAEVKVKAAGLTVAASVSSEATPTVTSSEGSLFSTTVWVSVLPSPDASVTDVGSLDWVTRISAKSVSLYMMTETSGMLMPL